MLRFKFLEFNLNNHLNETLNHYSYLHYLSCISTIATATSTLHKNYAQTKLKSRNDNAKQSNFRHPLTTITSRLLILSHPKIASESESERSLCRSPTTVTTTDRFFSWITNQQLTKFISCCIPVDIYYYFRNTRRLAAALCCYGLLAVTIYISSANVLFGEYNDVSESVENESLSTFSTNVFLLLLWFYLWN